MHDTIDTATIGNVSRMRLDRETPRNVPRLVLATSTLSGNGVNVEGHRVDGPTIDAPTRDAHGKPLTRLELRQARRAATPVQVETLIEVYVDRLTAVIARTRTDEHHRVHETAVRMHDEARQMECRARGLPLDTDLDVSWCGAPELHYPVLGYRTGLPPLTKLEVVHPRDGRRITPEAFLAMPVEEREDFMLRAPSSHENANDKLAETIARVLSLRGEREASAPEPRAKGGRSDR